MPGASTSQVKTALAEQRAARQKLANFVQPHSSAQRPESASQQALNKLLQSSLTKAGVDLNKFETLVKQGQAEVREWAAKRKAENDAQAAAMQKTMQQTIESWRNTLVRPKDLPVPPPSPFQYFLLTTATDVFATSGISLAATNIAATNNWAEFQLETSDSSTQEVSFAFSWQNASDKFAVIQVDGYIVFNGVCEAISQGGFFPGDRHSDVALFAELYLNLSSETPGTAPFTAASEVALDLQADSGGWFSDGEILYQQLFRGFDLQYQYLLMPPGSTVTIEVAGRMTYSDSEGTANYVFVTMGRQVLCPAVLVTVVS
jgi:hypothetical protein